MDDKQFRELRQILLDLTVRVSELELHLKRQDDIATERQNLMYDWCAPPAYKALIDAETVDIPDDLRKFFP